MSHERPGMGIGRYDVKKQSYFSGPTLDDVMKMSIEELLRSGKRVTPTRGGNTELTGILLEIENPRARLSRTEMRGKPFSCLGELIWYLRKTNLLEIIEYYIPGPGYKESSENGILPGAYGPRLFDWQGINQFENAAQLLKKNHDTRKAVIQLFDSRDLIGNHKDVPCTCTLQFFLRDGLLHMLTHMRSNDVYWGLPHDIFSFTMLQEIMARTVGVEIGTYKHSVGSFHLYDKHATAAESFIKEGWQSTQLTMPPMPEGDPWASINIVLEAESLIREESAEAFEIPADLDRYWADLIRLLQLLRCFKDNNPSKAKTIQKGLECGIYHAFIDKKIDSMSASR